VYGEAYKNRNIMRNQFFLIVLSLMAFVSRGQERPSVMQIQSTNKPWTNLNLNNDSKKFQFVVMPDHTGAHRPGILKNGIDRINLMQPEFVVSIGDLIEGYTQDPKEIKSEWDEFSASINQLKMPFFYLAGNHDYSNPEMAKFWKENLGPDYYFFVYKNVLFLCLNSEDGTTSFEKADLSEQQLRFVEKTLAANPTVDWTMVFIHQPLWLTPGAKNWLETEHLLSGRKHTVFSGHTHQYALYQRNNSDYFVLSTLGGVNTLRGKKYGEFDHFVWVTMTPNGPDYANIMIDGVEDKSVQTAENLIRVESFKTNPPVRFEPYYYREKPDQTISTKVVFRNDTREDHLYTVKLLPGKGLNPAQTNITKKVLAGSKDEIILPIQVNTKDGWSPIVANVHLVADKYEWDSNVYVQPNEKLLIPETVKPITTDGDLSEWEPLRFSKQDSTGKTGFRFDVCYDAQFLHLAIDVTDADIQAGSSYVNLSQDAALVVFDARNLAQSAFNQGNTDGVFRGEWLYMIASPTSPEFELGFKDKMPAGVVGKGRKAAKGYAVEYTVPLAILQKFQGPDWKNIRLNFSIINKNGNEGRPIRINWAPEWKDNYPGSGMFFKK
jgi:predicted phosphodiesterase